MTPKTAVFKECKSCNNTTYFHGCSSELCQLNNQDLPYVKRIKEHCLNCVPEQSIYSVKECDGKVTSPEPHICYLHPYRLGKNPKRQESGKALASRFPKEQGITPFLRKKETSKAEINSRVGLNGK